MLATILAIVGNLIPAILLNRGVIGSSTATLIASLLSPVQTLIANLMKSGSTTTSDFLAVLAALSGVIGVLKTTQNLPADVLTQINGADKDVQAALLAYAKAGTGFDITVYGQIAEV